MRGSEEISQTDSHVFSAQWLSHENQIDSVPKLNASTLFSFKVSLFVNNHLAWRSDFDVCRLLWKWESCLLGWRKIYGPSIWLINKL